MSFKKVIGVALFEGFFGLVAILSLVIENVGSAVRGGYDPLNLWSHFTYQSSLIAAIVLLTSSYYVWNEKESTRLDWFRGTATLYMIITGLVYALLLNNANPVYAMTDTITHRILPVVMVVAWLVHQPSMHIPREGWLGSDLWLAYPLVFAAYTQIYGRFIEPGNYIYGFLDPTGGNELHVLGMVVGLTAAAWLVSQLLILLPQRQPAFAS